VAGSLGFVTTQSGVTPLNIFEQPWIYLGVGLGIVFIASLLAIARGTAQYGISVAQVSNRMSLVIPISIAMLFYGDKLSIYKVIGIMLAIAAVYLVSHKESDEKSGQKFWWVVPLIIFICGGIIDSSLNYAQRFLLGEKDLDVFLSTIFSTAFIFGTIILVYQLQVKKEKFEKEAIPAGIIIGFLNYCTMFLIVKALNSGVFESSVLFPVNNLSALTIATIVSVLVFKEKLSSKNWLGMGLSLLAIFILGLLPQLLS
jgi:drug/metabolite transporter (DMT)-like permease